MSRWMRWARRLLPAIAAVGLLYLLWLVDLYRRAELTAPPPTALLEDRHGRFLAESEAERLGFWPVPQPLPQRISRCLIAVEDRRFQSHDGVDLHALARALVHNLRGGPRQGASTLAMQVARLQSGNPRTYANKLNEMIQAEILTHKFGRDAVLAHYLRIVPQGNRIHGVAYAARRYFQKPLADLSWAEAALLAGLPKAPGRMNLYAPSGRRQAIRRAHLVLNLLHQQGDLDEAALRLARQQLDNLQLPAREVRPYHGVHAILRLQEMLAVGAQNRAGQPLRATLDLDVQARVDSMAFETIERLRHRGAGNIAAMVTRKDGQVLAYLGSDFYADPTFAGAIDYARVPRSSGSTLKPFLYALGLERGDYTPASVLDDLPLHILHPGGHYTASNYDGEYLGPILYRRALANSRNIPALQVLQKTGLAAFGETLHQLGLVTNAQDVEPHGLGIAIGGLYVTLEQLVTAYGSLANEGQSMTLQWYRQTTPHPEAKPIFKRETAQLISRFLSDPQARLPSFPRMGNLEFPFPAAIKTGTSQGFRDAWSVAYSADYIVGVWIGHPDHLKMNRVGGFEAAALARDIMLSLYPHAQQDTPTQPFPSPAHYQEIALCPLTGERAADTCAQPTREHLHPTTVPAKVSTAHTPIAVDRRTGHRAGQTTPPNQIEIRNYLQLPPRYAAWAAKQGLAPPPINANSQPRPTIQIRSPLAKSRLRIDPDTPRRFQTLALHAEVTPAVPEIVWYVDGQIHQRTRHPYLARWQLKPGTHHFQARFPRANIASKVITLTVIADGAGPSSERSGVKTNAGRD